jgi:hypothetical protein
LCHWGASLRHATNMSMSHTSVGDPGLSWNWCRSRN